MSNRKLVLTGFMGTGKTSLAQIIAEKTGQQSIDIDDRIIERVGKAIPEIFADDGEPAFRAWETVVAAELAHDDEYSIIATGGGTLINPANRDVFQDAVVVCLTAEPQVIYDRVSTDGQRPLLNVDDPLKKISTLMSQRQPVYSQIRWQVDTSAKSLDVIADEIIEIWQQAATIREYEIRVQSPEGSYPILIEENSLDNIARILDVYGLLASKILVITDTNVEQHQAQRLCQQLPDAHMITMPAGESHKNLDTVYDLYDQVASHKTSRSSLIIALGGGVVGDTAGFVAASYMRGVKLVQIPTSLLAMVDSSVGGKVGVDIPSGKNLVGAFKQPELVLIDPTVLATLPQEEMISGTAEVIKCGLIADPTLLDESRSLREKIQKTVQVKIDIVQRDPYERGERAHLNLGHTFGHAIEKVSGYTWRHGDAVGVGLVGAAIMSHQLGMVEESMIDFVKDLVQQAGLPLTYSKYNPEEIYNTMKLDKKWIDGRSHFILLKDVAQPIIVKDVPKETILDVLKVLRT